MILFFEDVNFRILENVKWFFLPIRTVISQSFDPYAMKNDWFIPQDKRSHYSSDNSWHGGGTGGGFAGGDEGGTCVCTDR